MSYRSGGSRSGGGSGRRSTSRSGSSGRGTGQRSAGWDNVRDDAWDDRGSGRRGGWDDEADDYGRGYNPPRRGSSRPPSAGGWDDEDWRGGRGAMRESARGWDDRADDGWDGRGGDRGSRSPQSRGRGGSKTLLFVFAALILVIAIAVVGVLVLPGHNAHPTATIPDDPYATFTPGATPTIPDHFKVFQSDRSKYTIIYPEAWNATSKEQTTQGQYDFIDVFALQNAPSQLLVEQAGAAANYTDAQLIQNAVTLAQQNGVAFTKAQTQTPSPKIGGVTWTRQDYSVNANGTPVYMAVLACHHSGRGYVIVLASSASEFGNDDQAVFEPMLGSFTFQ